MLNERGFPELSWGPPLTPWNEIKQKLFSSLYHRKVRRVVRKVDKLSRQAREVPWVSGACMVIRRADLDAVGLLDERFFMYTEDVDLCVQMAKRGRTSLVHRRRRSAAPSRPIGGAQSRSRAAAAAEPRRVLRKAPAVLGAAVAGVSESARQAMTPLRIAIDARKLRDFGIGTYIRNILTELSRLDRTTEYVVLCRPDDLDSGDVLGRNFRMVPETAPTYSVAEQFRIPLSLARERVQLVHEPHYVLPPLVRCRSVVTIHDCIHLMFPQYLPSKLAHVYAKGSMWAAARKAEPDPHRLGSLEAGHPEILQRAAGEGRRHL